MYQGMTVKQLREECKSRGLKGYSRLPKAGLVSALEAPRGAFSYSEPCHTQAGSGGAEIKPHRLSPKATSQARQIDDQDRGGIPAPHSQQEAKMETTYRVTGVGHHSGSFEREFTDAQKGIDFARACVRKATSPKYAKTIKLARIVEALEQGEDVTITPAGQVTVSRHNGRAYAPPGYLIRGRRDGLTTNIGRTCNEQAWKDAGWALSLAVA